MKAVVVFNPRAGRGRGAPIAEAVERGLSRRGFEVELQATRRPRDASSIAHRFASEVDAIVAVGGDGTINEVTNGMARAASPDDFIGAEHGTGRGLRARLGIVPAGTVNVLALELGIPFQVERICNVIAEGKTISLDLGKVNGRRFVLMMGAGIDALTIRNLDMRAKRRFRELAFVTTGLRAGLAAPPPLFLARINGEEYEATYLAAGNSRYYGGRFGMTPHADPTDGVLDLMVFTGTARSEMAVFWMGVPSGMHLRNPHVRYLCSDRAELRPLDAKKAVWFQTDGELAGRLPATIGMDPHALEVFVP